MANAEFSAGAAVRRPEAIYKLDGQGKVTRDKDMSANLKAQAWRLLADRFRTTFNAVKKGEPFEPDEVISLSSNLLHVKKIIDELSTPRRDYDKNGRLQIESKKDLVKREVAVTQLDRRGRDSVCANRRRAKWHFRVA